VIRRIGSRRRCRASAAPGGFCLECSTRVEAWEGQTGARRYRFAAREVGEALAHVARGGTYRAASFMARQHAERMPDRRRTGNGRRRRDPARDGQMVANWVDVFAESLCDGPLPVEWPEILVIDSAGMRPDPEPRSTSLDRRPGRVPLGSGTLRRVHGDLCSRRRGRDVLPDVDVA
jgi:hypothetical protein